MDFLDSLDLHTDEKSNRVRSWYLYEQYKALEKSQLDAAKRLNNKSYQDRILLRELSERRARRRLSQEFDIGHSESQIERTLKSDSSKTPYSETTDNFESVCEQEDVVSEKEQEIFSQYSETSKFYDEFKSSGCSDDKINNSCSESINSVIEHNEVNENVADDIKEELELVKKNIAEIINLQIETEKECLEKYTELCDEETCDNKSLKSISDLKSSAAVDKFYPKYDNGILAIWSKLVAFSYNIMQMNRGNCYYDYSTQFLTGVLAFDVLRRGINRMCYVLQPYVSPIKFVNDEYEEPLMIADLNQKLPKSKKINKITMQKYGPICPFKFNERHRSFKRKYHSEEKWQSRCKYSFENRMNEMRKRGTSEPWRSVTKFSGDIDSFKEKKSCDKMTTTPQFDKCSSYCKCSQLKKAINPIIKLSHYIDMILREIEN